MKNEQRLVLAAGLTLTALVGYWWLNQPTERGAAANNRYDDETLSISQVDARASDFPVESVDGESLVYPPIDTPFVWDVEEGGLAHPTCPDGLRPRISVQPTKEWLSDLPRDAGGGQLLVADEGDNWVLRGKYINNQTETYDEWNPTNAVVTTACGSDT